MLPTYFTLNPSTKRVENECLILLSLQQILTEYLAWNIMYSQWMPLAVFTSSTVKKDESYEGRGKLS